MFLVLNWKMYPETLEQALAIFEETKKSAAKVPGKTVVAPPALYLRPLVERYKGRAMGFAVQNMHPEMTGAFTGEISAMQAKSAGASYALIGHAERRAMGETDADAARKVASALTAGLSPIICIGEKVRHPQSGEHLDEVRNQLAAALSSVSALDAKKLVVAYEPVWAIGAKEPMRPEHMHEMTIFIRKILWEKYEKTALKIPILYGGAVLDEAHATLMMKESEINGFLLGRASVDAERLRALMSAFAKK